MELKESYLYSQANKSHFALKLFTLHPTPYPRHFENHRHPEIEIALFKSGTGVYTTESREYSIKPNDIFLFRSNEIHKISKIDPDTDMTLMNVQFDLTMLWEHKSSFFAPNCMCLFSNNKANFPNRLDRNNPHCKEVQRLLLSMEKELYEKSAEYPLMVRMNLISIFVILIRHFNYNTDQALLPLCQNNIDAIERSIDYIYEHLSEAITLTDLAKVANMSETYYSSVFKRLTGSSPWNYISSKRVALAINYLMDNSSTMLDLAMRCGFNNTANFNRTFKKITGLTPSEYKTRGKPLQ